MLPRMWQASPLGQESCQRASRQVTNSVVQGHADSSPCFAGGLDDRPGITIKKGDEITVTYEKKGRKLIASKVECKRD